MLRQTTARVWLQCIEREMHQCIKANRTECKVWPKATYAHLLLKWTGISAHPLSFITARSRLLHWTRETFQQSQFIGASSVASVNIRCNPAASLKAATGEGDSFWNEDNCTTNVSWKVWAFPEGRTPKTKNHPPPQNERIRTRSLKSNISRSSLQSGPCEQRSTLAEQLPTNYRWEGILENNTPHQHSCLLMYDLQGLKIISKNTNCWYPCRQCTKMLNLEIRAALVGDKSTAVTGVILMFEHSSHMCDSARLCSSRLVWLLTPWRRLKCRSWLLHNSAPGFTFYNAREKEAERWWWRCDLAHVRTNRSLIWKVRKRGNAFHTWPQIHFFCKIQHPAIHKKGHILLPQHMTFCQGLSIEQHTGAKQTRWSWEFTTAVLFMRSRHSWKSHSEEPNFLKGKLWFLCQPCHDQHYLLFLIQSYSSSPVIFSQFAVLTCTIVHKRYFGQHVEESIRCFLMTSSWCAFRIWTPRPWRTLTLRTEGRPWRRSWSSWNKSTNRYAQFLPPHWSATVSTAPVCSNWTTSS